MPAVVGVSFKAVTKIYYFSPGSLGDLQAGEYVVVETARGPEIGQIVWESRQITEEEVSGRLKPVLRRATAWDLVERDQYMRREAEALATCQALAAEHNLPMKVVSAEYSFDGRRLVVSFTAEGRVDFRELVRDLAKAFQARIELKQIGVRDEAKVLDGMGKCGRQLCCASWLREFNPVTIKMAKKQNLPLNPSEISGVCGRLLCCLTYEIDTYTEARRRLPKVGSTVVTPQGRGRVRKVHSLRDSVTVRLEDESFQEFTVEELADAGGEGDRRACSGCPVRRRSPDAEQAEAEARTSPPLLDEKPDAEEEATQRRSSKRRRRRKRK